MASPLSKEQLDKIAYNKKYQDIMDELRRKSQENTQASLSSQKASIKKTGDKYVQYSEHHRRIREERHRTLGTESIAALILQMQSSLEAHANMSGALKLLLLKRAWLCVSENFNYNMPPNTPGHALAYFAEAARQTRVAMDLEGRFSEPLPAVLIPYLVEVDESGVLKVDLDVADQMSREDSTAFTNRFKPELENTVRNLIANPDGYRLKLESERQGDREEGVLYVSENNTFLQCTFIPVGNNAPVTVDIPQDDLTGMGITTPLPTPLDDLNKLSSKLPAILDCLEDSIHNDTIMYPRSYRLDTTIPGQERVIDVETGDPITQEDFEALRNKLLAPALQQEFGTAFISKPSAAVATPSPRP